jgi:acyl-CoA thioesterase FadM
MDGRKWYYASSGFSEHKLQKTCWYDDLLKVKTILKVKLVKIEFDYEIYNEKEELLTIASSFGFVDMKTARPTLPPDYVIEKLAKSKINKSELIIL